MTHFQDGTTPSAAISPIDVAHKPPSIASEQTGASVQSTSPSLLSMKAAKLKSKIKSKLHRRAGQDGDDDDDDVDEDDEDGLNDDNDAVAATGVVAVDHANSSSNPNANMTAAQMYADEQRAPDDTAARIASPANSFDADKGSPLTKTESIGRRSVDSSRAHARSQSDWKRTAEFHNLFDEITTDEVLISDYTSAWFKDILRHGRLYVGAEHLAFSCSIIGLKAQVVISYSDIASIEKTVTAKVIPNAISITLKNGENYLFSSFVTRDASYDLIVDSWRGENSSAYESMLADQAESSGLAGPDETVVAASPSPAATPKTASSAPASGGLPTKEGSAAVTTKAPHASTDCSGNHFKETSLDVRFPSDPIKIYELLYHNSEFLQTFWKTQKLTDTKIGEWQGGKRSTSYTKPLNGSVGPSSTTCYIDDEELAADPEKAYEILSITKTPDVPSGGSFQVETKSCLTWAGGSKGGCRLFVSTECKWSGKSWIKGIVTSASIAGQREYNIALAKAVRAHIKSHPAEFGASDSNAPEADDEVGTDEVNPERAEKEAVATGSHSPSFRTIVSDPFGNQNLPLTILALSNIALLIFILLTWSFSGKATKVTKSVMSAVNEQEAIVRLQRLETSWAKFKQCVDILTKDDI